MPCRGRVKWFSDTKGYGFIEQKDGTQAFVHYSDIVGGNRNTRLEEGEEVEYELIESQRGLKAENVMRPGERSG